VDDVTAAVVSAIQPKLFQGPWLHGGDRRTSLHTDFYLRAWQMIADGDVKQQEYLNCSKNQGIGQRQCWIPRRSGR
jgi:hypothetical protein